VGVRMAMVPVWLGGFMPPSCCPRFEGWAGAVGFVWCLGMTIWTGLSQSTRAVQVVMQPRFSPEVS